MKTHILFTNDLQVESKLTYTIELITKDWHYTSNNFKGTEMECKKEGEKQLQKAIEFFRLRRGYTNQKAHYPNAEYCSIYDY